MATITEVDDAPSDVSTPYAITEEDVFLGIIGSLGGSDWIAIDLVGGTEYAFTLRREGDGGLPDPYLDLFDSTGGFVADDDDALGNLESLLVFTPIADDTFYLAPRAYAGGSTGTYRLEVLTGLNEDEDAPADTTTPYALADLGESDDIVDLATGGRIRAGDDGDWYAMTLDAGVSVLLEVETVGRAGLFDAVMTVHAEDGTPIATVDDGGIGFDPAAIWTPDTAGTYYLAVAPREAGEVGSYTVSYTSAVRQGTDSDDLVALTPSTSGTAFRAGGGDDAVTGSADDDRIFGQGGADVILGLEGPDRIGGGRGADTLGGGQGDDSLVGGGQRDLLDGGQGDDVLTPGRGDDTALGGAGADTFVIGPRGGVDSLPDFDPSEDVLSFDGRLVGLNPLTGAEVVERYGSADAEATTLSFKDGTTVVLPAGLDLDELALAIFDTGF